MKKIIKYFLLIVFLLDFNVQVEAKPVPPGSGEGDVAANIIFLIDSSASMKRRINNRDAVAGITGAAFTTDGSIIAGQGRTLGQVKFDSSGSRDREYNNNLGRWTGDFIDSCEKTFTGAAPGVYTTANRNTTARHTHNTNSVRGIATNDGGWTDENLILFHSGDWHLRQSIVGVSENGVDCKLFVEMGFWVNTFDVMEIADEHIIFASGQEFGSVDGVFRTFNITTAEMGPLQDLGTGATTGRIMSRTWRSAVDNSASFYYLASNDIYGYSLQRVGNNYEIITQTRRYTGNARRSQLDTRLAPATDIDVATDDDDILYVVSARRHALQKVELTGDTTFNIVERAGTGRRSRRMNIEAAGGLAANSVRFFRPVGVTVTSTRILVTSQSGATIDVFDEDKFNATNVDTSWLLQMGGGRLTRWTGVKKAIAAILSDTSLTTGAHFGYGHWNAGEHGRGRDTALGGRRCHRGWDDCNYWTGWTNGTNSAGESSHVKGQSSQCNRDHCFEVAPNENGKNDILDELMPQGLAWGTDAKAFAQMGYEYFSLNADGGLKGHPYKPLSTCQLNYIIVIGDGEMMNLDAAKEYLTLLRGMDNPVKTLMVAYGGGISTRGLNKFDELAVAGSCEGGVEGHDSCEETIRADTPADLKTEITARIRQILAERLSFTAPSITANVQEGGSLYQAQFTYKQYGEWEGTLLRKSINKDNVVCHEIPGEENYNSSAKCVEDGEAVLNWNAATELLKQTSPAGDGDTRNIWTAMEGASYVDSAWDNFNENNDAAITDLFALLEHDIPDYHHSTSHCANVGEDGSHDDEIGLINFIKGSDYFDYDGDCDVLGQVGVDEVREKVLGDIYHSQLIEIGPPDGDIEFTNTNEETYYRFKNNYYGFKAKHRERTPVVYAGANSGLLHAFFAGTIDPPERGGREMWAFIPPFIVASLPTVISKALDGKVNLAESRSDGGSNAIFGVDGSPVAHDVFIQGYDGSNGCAYEATKSWHTVLFVPYGRGGAGFSVLDITYPLITAAEGPCHMFSVFNDAINNQVFISDRDGRLTALEYNSSSTSIGESLEAEQADSNFQTAQDDDGWPDNDVTTEQDAIAECQQNADAGSATPAFTGPFRAEGTASCYEGRTFTFSMGEMETKGAGSIEIPKQNLRVAERIDGVMTNIDFDKAEYENGLTTIYFSTNKTYNPRGPGKVTVNGAEIELPPTTEFNISTSCIADRGIDQNYDYSQLGETWSNPRIFRIPSYTAVGASDISEDRYVAAFGAGMGNVSMCAGNAFYIVDLESGLGDMTAGRIYGADVNGGPITIVDTDPRGLLTDDGKITTTKGSDIGNAMPAPPVVITPETAFNIPWRGAMVYINDLEGKITKINLTNQDNDNYGNVRMFDQTTLFRLDASTINKRYSYFQMDAGVGLTNNEFWLFGGTGDFNNIGGVDPEMDNILYGIKDPDYPYFKHLNSVIIPRGTEGGFLEAAHTGADSAKGIDDYGTVCIDVTGDNTGVKCPKQANFAWVVHLDTLDGIDPELIDPATKNPITQHTFRKVSATPTIFRGNVYFPIYEPPGGGDACGIGNAFICVTDDECGTNNSHLLQKGARPEGTKCNFVREGILSEIVIFGDTLFANVAGPKEDARTLYKVLAAAGEVSSARGSWRETGY